MKISMTFALSADLEKRVAERVDRGDYDSPDSLVSEAVEWLLAEDQAEIEETRSAIQESIEQSGRGETVALEDFVRSMYRQTSVNQN